MVKLGDLESDRTGKLIAEAILLRIYSLHCSYLSLSLSLSWIDAHDCNRSISQSVCQTGWAGLGWATTAQINNIKTILIGVVLF
jgi:hypothetical protein